MSWCQVLWQEFGFIQTVVPLRTILLSPLGRYSCLMSLLFGFSESNLLLFGVPLLLAKYHIDLYILCLSKGHRHRWNHQVHGWFQYVFCWAVGLANSIGPSHSVEADIDYMYVCVYVYLSLYIYIHIYFIYAYIFIYSIYLCCTYHKIDVSGTFLDGHNKKPKRKGGWSNGISVFEVLEQLREEGLLPRRAVTWCCDWLGHLGKG